MQRTPQQLLSTPEAAEVAGTHRSTITRWVQSGRLVAAHKTPGGVLLFTREAVEAALTAEATS